MSGPLARTWPGRMKSAPGRESKDPFLADGALRPATELIEFPDAKALRGTPFLEAVLPERGTFFPQPQVTGARRFGRYLGSPGTLLSAEKTPNPYHRLRIQRAIFSQPPLNLRLSLCRRARIDHLHIRLHCHPAILDPFEIVVVSTRQCRQQFFDAPTSLLTRMVIELLRDGAQIHESVHQRG